MCIRDRHGATHSTNGYVGAPLTQICDTGQNKSILTLHELAQGDFVARHHLPLVLLRMALQTQVRKERAQVFSVTADRWGSLLNQDLLAQATDESMAQLGVKFV